MNRRQLGFGLLGLLAQQTGAAAGARRDRETPLSPGEFLPPFTLPQAGGGSREWQPGRVTVLTFCAFWCDTWKPQSVRLQAAQRTLSGLPMEFLFISVDGRWVERGLAAVGKRVLVDGGGSLTASLGLRAVPYTLVVDPSGRIRWVARGIVRTYEVIQQVRSALTTTRFESGAIYLTFDDFPAPEGDDTLLDLLRAKNVLATFFCVGKNVEARPELVRRAVVERHSLQLHAWDHDARDPQLNRCQAALKRAGALPATLYRPPGAAHIARMAGGILKHPTVNPYDFTRPGVQELTRRVLPAAKPGSVLLLHAGVGETREALPALLQGFAQRGLICATLP